MTLTELETVIAALDKAERILRRSRVTHDEKEYALHLIGRAKEILSQ